MTTNDSNQSDCNRSSDEGRKQPYNVPVLQVFGDIRALTQSTLAAGTADGMSGTGMMHSSP